MNNNNKYKSDVIDIIPTSSGIHNSNQHGFKVWKDKDHIIGLNIKHVWCERVRGHNCDFEYYRGKSKVYELFIKDTNNVINKVTFTSRYGECGSGWTISRWCNYKIETVNYRGSITHVPKGYTETNFLDYDKNPDKYKVEYRIYDYKDDIIDYSSDGGDSYYPSGHINIDLGYFTKTNRGFDEPVVWLTDRFIGRSKCITDYDMNRIDNILYGKFDFLDIHHVTNVNKLKKLIDGKIININVTGNNMSNILIFYGPSNTGKSYIAHKYFDDNKIYETDQSDTLNILPYHEVIVLGNKYKFTLDQVINQINGDYQICEFSED